MFLGIELGSTRIKAVIIGGDGTVIASGAFTWENKPLAAYRAHVIHGGTSPLADFLDTLNP